MLPPKKAPRLCLAKMLLRLIVNTAMCQSQFNAAGVSSASFEFQKFPFVTEQKRTPRFNC